MQRADTYNLRTTLELGRLLANAVNTGQPHVRELVCGFDGVEAMVFFEA